MQNSQFVCSIGASCGSLTLGETRLPAEKIPLVKHYELVLVTMGHTELDIGKGSSTVCVSRELLHISHRGRILGRAPGATLTTADVTYTEDISEPQDLHGTGYTPMTAPSACFVGPVAFLGRLSAK